VFEPSPAEKYFGLSARPFSLTPDLRFAFHSRSHSHALEQVTMALRRREGLIVVTGAIGTGKTMLCRAMLDSFEPRTFISVILDPGLEVEDLLRTVLTDFGIMGGIEAPATGPLSDVTRHQFVSTLQQFLSSLAPLQAHAVIMIDEAQRLNARVLEEIRLLTNFETDEAKLLQVVLVGQPELDEMLREPAMQQLNQRVARRVELQPLSVSEVNDYVERRLTVAASAEALAGKDETNAELASSVRFTPEAIESIAEISRGIPRLVNTVCDRALDAAYERSTRVVDRDSVLEAAQRLRVDLPGELAGPRDSRLRWIAAAVAGLLIVAGAAWWFLPRTSEIMPERTPTSRAPAAPAGKDAQPEPGTASTAADPPGTPAPAPAASAGQAAAPAPPQPTTPAAPAPATRRPAAADGFQITVASFRTEQRADDVVAAIGAMQVPVAVRTDSKGTWFRVVAGPFANREAATAAQQVLARGGFEGTQVAPITAESR
jgi:general secretion pathway protein A